MSDAGVAGRRVCWVVLAVGLQLAPAAFAYQAAAATLSASQACYVNSAGKAAPMALTGSGFGAGDSVSISAADGSFYASTTADASGVISFVTGAPTPFFGLPGQKVETLTATDFPLSGGEITASTTVTVAPLAVATIPGQAKFTRKVTWYFSGFIPGEHIYAHYLRGHKQVALTRFGGADGPCGVSTAKARLYPGGHPRFKKYGVQIDDSRHYDKHASPRIDTSLGTVVL
jgi:hypothetical protein